MNYFSLQPAVLINMYANEQIVVGTIKMLKKKTKKRVRMLLLLLLLL